MGKLSGTVVTCPGHGLRYDVTTGQTLGTTPGVRSYPVEVRADGVYVDLEPPAASLAQVSRKRVGR
jgi:nitrite reductase/ring-hydroxylating ferredoxin subunit